MLDVACGMIDSSISREFGTSLAFWEKPLLILSPETEMNMGILASYQPSLLAEKVSSDAIFSSLPDIQNDIHGSELPPLFRIDSYFSFMESLLC